MWIPWLQQNLCSVRDFHLLVVIFWNWFLNQRCLALGKRTVLAHVLKLGLARVSVDQSLCKEPLMTFAISPELQQSLSLLAFLDSGSASWSWACGRAAHSWAGSSCSVRLLRDRPMQIELIAYEFPLACHIGRVTPGFSLLSFQTRAKPKAHENQGVEVRIYLAGLNHTDQASAWIKHHPTRNLQTHLGLWQL